MALLQLQVLGRPGKLEADKCCASMATDYVELADCVNPPSASADSADVASNRSTIPSRRNKCIRLCTNLAFWVRISILVLCAFLLLLSLSYSIAQIAEVKLKLITKCASPKTREEIWLHSFEATNNARHPELTRETQYGFTDEPCWTTKNFEMNTDSLWYSNHYVVEFKSSVNARFTLFALIALYCLLVIMYGVATLCADIASVAKGTLHTKSRLYRRRITLLYALTPNCLDACVARLRHCKGVYDRYFETDSTAWICLKIGGDILEMVLQSQALLLYNGYYWIDPDATYLANKPQFIILFACFVSFSVFGSGLLWLCYALAPRHCHSLLFRRLYFFVDKFSDLQYCVYPMLVVSLDDYANSDNVWVLLGQLNIDSTLAFLSTAVPLSVLCHKCLLITRSETTAMRNASYYRWKEGQSTSLETETSSVTSVSTTKARSTLRTIVLSVVSLALIVCGVLILTLVSGHINASVEHCDSVKESNYFANGSRTTNISLSDEEMDRLDAHPELFVWDKCLYKVYPFTRNTQHHPCQCRVVVIEDWRDESMESTYAQRQALHSNLTQQRIIGGMLGNWFMLEKMRTAYAEGDFSVQFELSASMFTAKYMRAFEWTSAKISHIADSISVWQSLEYLHFANIQSISALPSDLHQLKWLKYLSLVHTGLTEFSEQICNLTQLSILRFQWNDIKSVPHCISDLVLLKQLLIDSAFELEDVPMSIFNLPNLYELSLFQSSISYESLIAYNLPDYIAANDTFSVMEWLNSTDTFGWNRDTKYYLQRSPLCDEVELLPMRWQTFISNHTECEFGCIWDADGNPAAEGYFGTYCSPSILGDGRCDNDCHWTQCAFDAGGLCLSSVQNFDPTHFCLPLSSNLPYSKAYIHLVELSGRTS